MTNARDVVPYGAWPSPISATEVAHGGIGLAFPAAVQIGSGRIDGGVDVWWTEGRPSEGGRQVVVSESRGDLLPPPWSARTRVHEYGGACWIALSGSALPGNEFPELAFAEWSDQRIYRVGLGAQPRPLTPKPSVEFGLRYADFVLSPDGGEIWCVREEHSPDGGISRAIVAVSIDGSAADDASRIRVIVAGSHFLAYPRPSSDGRRLAWIAWEHPNMPWDASQLRIGDLVDGVVSSWRPIVGGPGESVLQPEWVPNRTDRLYVISDRSGWWNLYEVGTDAGEPRPIAPASEEFGAPLWQLGYCFYAILDDGRLAVRHGVGAGRLGVLDPRTGRLHDLDMPFTAWDPVIRGAGHTVVGVAGGPGIPPSVVKIDAVTGAVRLLRRSADRLPDPGFLPEPHAAVLAGPGNREVHAVVYPPRNPNVVAPQGELPPYLVHVHGGPTASARTMLNLEFAYFTSRGIGVITVDYGGSAGYGREYRERLRGQWGVVDVEDCVAAAHALADKGEADPARLAVRGGSAGGWTTLAALTRTKAFAAGTSYFGVAELLTFVHDTHDFESRYIDGLIGPLPATRDLYIERAPLSHVDDVSCPVLLLQGLDDKVVPPSQAEMFRDALAAKKIPHAYLAFEGEQHGFRRAETVVAALEAELSFYGQVFGFTP
ncbi:MAG TPA: prolyl oligopeptidase family serine peptidase, partial [Mycobacterium sp.]|nr:prolyl oligopeptidase family serine peptidase [Mycobacterium sp.]